MPWGALSQGKRCSEFFLFAGLSGCPTTTSSVLGLRDSRENRGKESLIVAPFLLCWMQVSDFQLTKDFNGSRFLVGKIIWGATHGFLCTKSAQSIDVIGPSWCLSGKEFACQCRRHGFNPWSGRSSGKGNGNPLQQSCLGNPMHREAWLITVHGVAKGRT